MNNIIKSNDFKKWIFFIPLSIFIFIFSKFCINFPFYIINKPFIETINLNRGFGGYLISGTIFVLFRESIAIGLAIYSGVYLVPKKKKTVFIFFLAVYIFLIIILSFFIGISVFIANYSFEEYFRIIIEIIAHIIGFSIAGYLIWKEEKSNSIENNSLT